MWSQSNKRFQDIAFTSNCERTDGQTDGRTDRRTDRAIPYVPSFDRHIKDIYMLYVCMGVHQNHPTYHDKCRPGVRGRSAKLKSWPILFYIANIELHSTYMKWTYIWHTRSQVCLIHLDILHLSSLLRLHFAVDPMRNIYNTFILHAI